jgi:hypothetical protein
MDWKFRGSNPCGGKISRSRPDRPWGPAILLYDGYRISFTGVKPLWRGAHNPLPSSAEVKETVDLISLWAFMACSRVNWVPNVFPRGMQPGYGADHTPSSTAEVKEEIELYLYTPVLG